MSTILDIPKSSWIQGFKILKYSTKDSKLWWLQFRILHNILTTNRSVSKFKQEQSHLCTFCNAHSETIPHLIWECSKTKMFWKELSTIFNRRVLHSHKFQFTKNLVILGICNTIKTDKVCNIIILMAKFFIYRCKVNKTELNLKCFLSEIYNRYCIEKQINMNSVSFRNSWGPYINLFKSLM